MAKSIQNSLNTKNSNSKLSSQEAINALASSTGKSIQDALLTYSTGTAGMSTQQLANKKAATTGLSIQDALDKI